MIHSTKNTAWMIHRCILRSVDLSDSVVYGKHTTKVFCIVSILNQYPSIFFSLRAKNAVHFPFLILHSLLFLFWHLEEKLSPQCCCLLPKRVEDDKRLLSLYVTFVFLYSPKCWFLYVYLWDFRKIRDHNFPSPWPLCILYFLSHLAFLIFRIQSWFQEV